MILVSNGIGLSLMHFGRDWKLIYKKSGEEDIPPKNNFYSNKIEKIKHTDIPDNEIVLWDYHMSNFYSDELRWKGKLVVNGFRIAKHLEQDREASISLFQKLDIPTPNTYFAKDYDDAVVMINDCDFEKMVVKPSGDVPSWTTQICENKDEALIYLEANEELLSKCTNIAIQEFVEGEEISCEVWIGKDGVWKETINHTIESKKFLSGNLGVSTGSEHSLVWFPLKSNQITKYTLDVAKWLHEQKYIGCIDVNFIVDARGNAYALEVTPRLGYNAHYGLFALIDEFMGIEDFFHNLYSGKLDIMPAEKNKFAFVLRITVPPYPLEVKESDAIFDEYFDKQRIKIYDGEKPDNVMFIPECINPDSKEIMSYCVGQVVGVSKKWNEAVKDTYDFAKNGIKCLNKQYRDDGLDFISERFAKLYGKLK